MKLLTLLPLLFCLVLETIAQKDSVYQSFIKKRYDPVHISLAARSNGSSTPITFSNIQVVDLRRDTSRIGLSGKGWSQGEMIFHTPTANAISAWLNQYYGGTKDQRSLLVAIKDLWLFDDKDSIIHESFRKNIYTKPEGNLEFRFEAYLRTEGGYVPLTYLDTMMSSTLHKAAAMARYQVPELMTAFMDKLASLDIDAIAKRRRVIAYAQIDSFSRTRFNYPMDTAVTFNKGVYANVEEFRNNQPSISEYKIIKEKDSIMELQIRDKDGSYYYTHTMWGFCDGMHCFVMMDGNLFPILPIQHQFYVFGSKEYKAKKTPIPFYIPIPGGGFAYGVATATTSMYRKLSLFRLDTISGEVIQ